MKEEQRLFLVQATSAFAVFKVLKENRSLHHCHALHYLQMTTELLGKAHAWKDGPIAKSHKALVVFLRSLSSNSKAKKELGFEGQNENWSHTIRKAMSIAKKLENLAPTLANDGPNPEYPWPSDAPIIAPTEYEFPIWDELTGTARGRTMLSLIENLVTSANEYL